MIRYWCVWENPWRLIREVKSDEDRDSHEICGACREEQLNPEWDLGELED